MIVTQCAECQGTGIWENTDGYPDKPRTMDCDPCFGHGEFAIVTCSACQAKTTIPGGTTVKGCTYDCSCERVMLIQDDGTTVDLYEQMAANIQREYGVTVGKEGFGYIEL
jgi:DnaJ-class molecular chaperone